MNDQVDRRAVLLAGGAALVTVVFWASAFVAIRQVGHDFGPGALALGRLIVGSVVLGLVVLARRIRPPRPRRTRGGDIETSATTAVADPATAARALDVAARNVGTADCHRRAVVRRLQRIPERGRAAGGCGDSGDAGERRTDPDRGARRAGAPGGLSEPARRRSGHRVRRCRGHRPGYLRRRRRGRVGRRGLPGGGDRLRGVGGDPETAVTGDVGAARDVDRVYGRRDCVPAVCTRADPRNRPRASGQRVVDRLPRRVPDRARVHHVGVRPGPHECRPARRVDVRGAADRDPARMVAARRGTGRVRLPRRRAVPARRLRVASARAQSADAGSWSRSPSRPRSCGQIAHRPSSPRSCHASRRSTFVLVHSSSRCRCTRRRHVEHGRAHVRRSVEFRVQVVGRGRDGRPAREV